MKKTTWRFAVSGAAAGAANGLFGGGGGSVLVPLLTRFCGLEQRQAFSTSLAVILAPVRPVRGGLSVPGRTGSVGGPALSDRRNGGRLAGRQMVPGGAGGVAPACLRGFLLLYGGARCLL